MNLDTVEDWRKKLPQLIEGYELADVWNCDETGLFFRGLPDHTLAQRGAQCKGGKQAKERLTVLLFCSATGEKFKLLVIGKSENPRAFKNIDKSKLPVIYAANRKAWMTGAIFEKTLEAFNAHMRKRNRRVCLLMDQAPVHNIAKDRKFSNVEVKFLPANTTPFTQPIDQGIVHAWKARYRARLLRRLIAVMESSASASDVVKKIDI